MPGTYIAVRVHPESERLIREFMELYDVPIVYPNVERRRHITLVSSDDDFVKEFEAKPDVKYMAMPKKLDVMPTREGNPCLVLHLECTELVARHNEILERYNATDRYPEFKCHISFSYDIGNYDMSKLPPFMAPIVVGEEYCEEFNANWVNRK